MTNQEAYLETEILESEKERDEKELSKVREHFASQLRGEMGRDINDVLSGKIKVDVSPWRLFKFKVKCFFNRIFEIL